MNIRSLLAASLIAPFLSAPAFAGLIGTTFDIGYYFPDTGTAYSSASFWPSTFTVGAGVETVGSVEGVTDLIVDVSNTALSVTFDSTLATPTWSGAAFNGIILTTTGPLGVGVPVTVSGSLGGFDASRVTLTGNEILLDWGGLSYVDGTVLKISFTDPSAQVPEPMPLALVGFGLAALTTSRQRTRA